MAAEAGWADLVKLMMGNKLVAIGSDYVNDRINGKSLVHDAITGKSIEVLDIVLSKNSILIHSIDKEGRSPLSHAAPIGYYNGVSYLLDKFIQGTYQRNQNGFFPIHMAASRGHVEFIQEFLRCCPDSSKLLNKQGQNIVHMAAKNGKDNVIKCVLKTPELEKFINERDEKGNTPLHLVTMHWRPKIVNSLMWDKRVQLELVNDAGLTALDVAEKYIGTAPPFRKDYGLLVGSGLKCGLCHYY
ncbi:Protein ACCELERATED CELL DEATH 6 [Camellia lanceoleosa]|uniref:Protein ACCELERATED CELL DEATH 6 n=1 Tax=Camellia lanceoleosa TaxID=1840588 RepID=A0ACC0H7X0_9ERIC|nr:Protein ACCELERATED CELL DEATH 6 [Camellia lanceoleosa]